MEIGNLVIYNQNFTCKTTDEPSYRYGILMNIDVEGYLCHVMSRHGCFSSIPTEFVCEIDSIDSVVKEIKSWYEEKINAEKEKFKSVKGSDYIDGRNNRYEALKTEILNTAKNMVESDNDESFENRLKAICDKKKQLFSIENKEVIEAREYNGKINYDIKQLEQRLDSALSNLNRLDAFKRTIPWNI